MWTNLHTIFVFLFEHTYGAEIYTIHHCWYEWMIVYNTCTTIATWTWTIRKINLYVTDLFQIYQLTVHLLLYDCGHYFTGVFNWILWPIPIWIDKEKHINESSVWHWNWDNLYMFSYQFSLTESLFRSEKLILWKLIDGRSEQTPVGESIYNDLICRGNC